MALKLYTNTTGGLKVYASDYKAVIKQLNTIDPQHVKQLKKDYRTIATKAQQSVKAELKQIGPSGPIGKGMLHGGRTGWGRNYGTTGGPVSGANRQPYDSVLIDAFTRPKSGQTGIARLRVRSAATVIADLAQKFSGRSLTRSYKIRLFGGPEIERRHRITYKSVAYFIRALGPIRKSSKKNKSRNVYPGFDKAYPQVKAEAEKAIQKALKLVEANIDRISR
jgi:hypothetical protein